MVYMSARHCYFEGVLTCSMCHWVSGQHTHRITFSALLFAVNGFSSYFFSQDNFGALNSIAASIGLYVKQLTFLGGGIWSPFPAKAFANFEITVLSMLQFNLPVLATPDGHVHN